MKVCVIGTGYVGLVTAACLADTGHHVICIDINEEKITALQSGICPIYEPGLDELITGEHISYTADYEVCADADAILIAVGTPELYDGSVNLTYVFDAVHRLAQVIRKDTVVAVKSTVPVGTNEKIEAIMRAECPYRIAVVSNPEFLSQGTAVCDTLHASRIVIGTEDPYAAQCIRKLYRGFDAPILVTKRASAEMIKYASNDFLALKLSYINEIANICEIVGADIDEVTQGMGYDKRIGRDFLKAGVGYGGSCFPKDTKALHWLAQVHGYELKTIKAAIEVNESQKLRLLAKAREKLHTIRGIKAAVLGVTFKEQTDDLRESPALANLCVLLEEGAEVSVWDPQGLAHLQPLYGEQLLYCAGIDEAVRSADVCFIFTAWHEIRDYDVKRYVKLMRRPLVLDGRGCYDTNEMKKAGVEYFCIGK